MGTPLQKRSQVAAGAGGWGGESNITRSAWFDGSASHLDRTPSSASSDRTRQIWGCWVRRIDFSAAARGIFGAGTGASARTMFFLSTHDFYWELSGGITARSVQVFRDHEWMHFVASYDGNETGNAERLKVYFNGVEIELTFAGTLPTTPQHFGDAILHTIGSDTGVGNVMYGSLAQAFHIADKSIQNGDHAITDLGESVAVGNNGSIWAPRSDAAIKALVDAGGSNSFLLSSAIGDGTDDSGVAIDSSGFTVTAPSGGTASNAVDGDDSTVVTTTGAPVNGDVIVHFDCGSAQSVTGVRAANLSQANSAAISFKVQYSTDNVSFFDWDTFILVSPGNTPVTSSAGGSQTAQYWRIIANQNFDAAASVGELTLYSTGVRNDFTPTSMSDAANGSDDTPSNPLIVMSPIAKVGTTSRVVQSHDGGVIVGGTISGQYHSTNSSLPIPSSGKWYFECEQLSGAGVFAMGVWNTSETTIADPGANANSAVLLNNGSGTRVTRRNGVATNSRTSDNNGDIFQVAFDADTGNIWLGRNDTWYGGGEPDTDTTPTYTLDIGPPNVYAFHMTGDSNKRLQLMRESEWTYTVPTDYKELRWSNLSEPPTVQGADLFNALPYTGDNTAIGSGGQSQTGVGFQPDFVWAKGRNTGSNHRQTDSSRGTNLAWQSDVTNPEVSETEGLSSFDADGFTHGNLGGWGAAFNYVAWCWKVNGGTTAANSDGDILSTVQVGEFLSIVQYTGNATASQTVGHGLGAAPDMIITKNLDASAAALVWFNSFSAQYLNLTNTSVVSAGIYGTTMNSTVFEVESNTEVNGSGNDMISYVFKNVPGVCQVGRYFGNGSTDGPLVNVGFRPRWIFLKGDVSPQEWLIYDTARDPFNNDATLYLEHDSGTEGTSGVKSVDFLANGYKIRDTSTTFNQSGTDYYYIAIADVASGSGLPPIPGR